jgi:hypothetical protein
MAVEMTYLALEADAIEPLLNLTGLSVDDGIFEALRIDRSEDPPAEPVVSALPEDRQRCFAAVGESGCALSAALAVGDRRRATSHLAVRIGGGDGRCSGADIERGSHIRGQRPQLTLGVDRGPERRPGRRNSLHLLGPRQDLAAVRTCVAPDESQRRDVGCR